MFDYQKITTDNLLDFARKLDQAAETSVNRQFWLDSLVEIDAELTSREPVGEFRMLVDEAGQPVGFERVVGSF